jgi:RNA polymerase sigma-70 factor, ECF subfamily
MATAVQPAPSYAPPADLSPLERLAGGSFEHIYKYNYARILNTISRIVHNRAAAEEIVNNVFTKVWEKRNDINSYRGQAAFSTWLTRIAINDSLMYLRRERVASRVVSLDENLRLGDESEIQQDVPMRDLRLEGVIDRDALTSAIAKLPQPYRVVLVARLIDGMSTEETCEALGLAVTVVKSRLHRSRHMLQGWLSKRPSKK